MSPSRLRQHLTISDLKAVPGQFQRVRTLASLEPKRSLLILIDMETRTGNKCFWDRHEI
ncbi:hypothetical protein CY34DRAFT_797072 [Suillus luteus UH-Slu-Lm8-n1]|uniref:Uncharacterized protein n=1 Tax=Suillus luteus UH-Slu-Lm8-n1 TaxID=930992 RepID=A0A0D0B6E6_9AGAM|nr:hypothetical protein CY34DRAFT_797072 [Suillus luteus UH-Slu-Lm8-n1]